MNQEKSHSINQNGIGLAELPTKLDGSNHSLSKKVEKEVMLKKLRSKVCC
jgi:hypothetical protein